MSFETSEYRRYLGKDEVTCFYLVCFLFGVGYYDSYKEQVTVDKTNHSRRYMLNWPMTTHVTGWLAILSLSNQDECVMLACQFV